MHSKHLTTLLCLSALMIVGAMAMGASAAQGAVHILLNGASVNLVNLNLLALHASIEVFPAFTILCEHGTGTAHFTTNLVTSSGSFDIVLSNCVWVGSGKTCTINDPGTGVGTVGISGENSVYMEGANWYIEAESSSFSTIYTEGVFCNIPSEEVMSGSFKAIVNNAEAAATSHSVEIVSSEVFFGESTGSFELEAHITDANPTATLALHL